MDDRAFDRVARLLGGAATRRAGLRAALGALLASGGLAAIGVHADAGADARARGAGRADRSRAGSGKGSGRRTCRPACAAGFVCRKVGRKRACVCESAVTCGAACCAAGQSCVDGACAAPPEPDRCIAAGQPCAGLGRPCCGGRTCASGQGGTPDVACYVPKAGACARTAECVYGMACRDGRCAAPPPAGPGEPCGGPEQRQCATPGAACAAYDAPGAPAGTFCLLPSQATCGGNGECRTDRCGYPAELVPGTERGTPGPGAAGARTCCAAAGQACGSDRDCCEGTACRGGTCAPDACTVCAAGCAHATIAGAIAAGEADVRIAAGVYPEHDLPAPPGPTLRLRPCGAGPVTIDARKLGRVMEIVDGKTVTVERLEATNGEVEFTDGGGFRVSPGGRLVLTGATVSNCSASISSGGGVGVECGALEATGTTVTGCTALTGGGVWIGGPSRSALTDCRLDGNAAESTSFDSQGGGLAVENVGSCAVADPAVDVIGGSISDNVAGPEDSPYYLVHGGGVYVNTEQIPVRLRDVVVAGNVARGPFSSGGGIYVGMLANVAISGRGVIARNVAALAGGVNSEGGAVVLEDDVAVRNNRAVGALGAGGGIRSFGDLTIRDNVVVEGNEATRGGGIFSITGPAAGATLEDAVVVRDNRANCYPAESIDGLGGGVYVGCGPLTLGDGVSIERNVACSGGGGVYVTGFESSCKGALILSGNATIRGNRGISDPVGSGVLATSLAQPVACPGSSARSCGNPDNASATGATNCAGDGGFDAGFDAACADVCVGTGNADPGRGACAPA